MMIKSEIESYREMEQLVRNAIEEYDPTRKLSPEELATAMGVTLKYVDLNLDREGLYHEESSQILINDAISNEDRKNFTAYHEICHHLLLNDDLYSDMHDMFVDDTTFNKMLERLCDVGAAEFLMPKLEIEKIIYDNGFSIELIELIANTFKVSKASATWRLTELASHKCIIVILRKDMSSLIVEYSWSSKDMRYPLTKGTVIPKDHPIWDFVDSNGVFEISNTYIPFKSGTKMDCHIEGKRINSRIYVCFNHTLPISSDQLSFF